MPNPDYITHIKHSSNDPALRDIAWCGEDLQYTFAFGNIDHATYSVQGGSRLVPCKECIDAVMRTLKRQYEESNAGMTPPVNASIKPPRLMDTIEEAPESCNDPKCLGCQMYIFSDD